MLKLKWQQRLRLWVWQQRRLLILLSASLSAIALTLSYNLWLLAPVPDLPTQACAILTMGQCGLAGLVVILVLLVAD